MIQDLLVSFEEAKAGNFSEYSSEEGTDDAQIQLGCQKTAPARKALA